MPNIGKLLIQNRSIMMFAVLFFATSALFFPPLIWGAAILIALASMVTGPQEGLMVLAWAALPIVGFVFANSYQQVLVFLLFNLTAVWAIASILCSTRSWNLVLSAMVAFGALLVVVILYLLPHFYELLGIAVSAFVQEVQKTNDIQVTADQMKLVTHMSLGYYVFDFLLSSIFALLVARSWQAKMFNPGGLSKEFLLIRPDMALIVILAGVLISALMQVHVALSLLPVVVFPFVFFGFSAVHRAVVDNPNKRVLLGFFCLACVFLLYVIFPALILSVIS